MSFPSLSSSSQSFRSMLRVCAIGFMVSVCNVVCSTPTHAQILSVKPVASTKPTDSVFKFIRPNSQPVKPLLAQLSQSDSANLSSPQLGAAGGEQADAANAAPVAQPALDVDLGLIRRVEIGGKRIDEYPTRVGNLDVLAPIVDQLSALGASASRVAVENLPGNPNTPTNDQSFQINLPQGPPIVMTVGKAVAYINQVETPLRAAPLVIAGKIWLPIYSTMPLLGAATRLTADGTLQLNPTVQSVELFPVRGTTVLTIKTSAPLRPDGVLMGTMDDPAKIYLDFPGYSMGFDASYSTNEKVISGGLAEVVRVRGGLFKKFPDTTRVVLDLKKNMRAVMQPLPDKTVFALLLVPEGVNKTPPTVPATLNIGPNTLRGLTIVVDAGHGAHDAGARGFSSNEKSHTLDIAKRLRTYLQQRGANVLMTRDTDVFITLNGRSDFANSRQADLFLSVHINSFKSNSTGTETFYYTAQSLTFAREVHAELVKATGLRNRGVSQARFSVIRKSHMPSILTETAFISNPNEERLLMQPTFRDRVARGLAQGVQNYANKYLTRTTPG